MAPLTQAFNIKASVSRHPNYRIVDTIEARPKGLTRRNWTFYYRNVKPAVVYCKNASLASLVGGGCMTPDWSIPDMVVGGDSEYKHSVIFLHNSWTFGNHDSNTKRNKYWPAPCCTRRGWLSRGDTAAWVSWPPAGDRSDRRLVTSWAWGRPGCPH